MRAGEKRNNRTKDRHSDSGTPYKAPTPLKLASKLLPLQPPCAEIRDKQHHIQLEYHLLCFSITHRDKEQKTKWTQE